MNGVLKSVENCWSYSVEPNRNKKRLELRGGPSRCLHYYHYFQDRQLLYVRHGLIHKVAKTHRYQISPHCREIINALLAASQASTDICPISPTMNTHAVIWDVDGTLVDTSELHYQAWVELAAKRDFPFSRTDFEATFGRRNPDIIGELFGEHLTAKEIEDIGDEKEALYRDAVKCGIELLPGVRDLLRSLHEFGCHQAVGSSAPRGNVNLILEMTRTCEFFSAIVSMEDCSRGKPDPQVFLIAAVRLGISPENCLVIEDAAAGVQAAKAGGMKCVGVTIAGHFSPEKLREAGADLVVGNLEEVGAENVKSLFA